MVSHAAAQEWRHQNGMRALGIPNNKNFFEVTQIKDALELWNSIQARAVDCAILVLPVPRLSSVVEGCDGVRIVARSLLWHAVTCPMASSFSRPWSKM